MEFSIFIDDLFLLTFYRSRDLQLKFSLQLHCIQVVHWNGVCVCGEGGGGGGGSAILSVHLASSKFNRFN